MYIGLHVKCPLFLPDFLCRFSKKTQIENFMKIRSVGAELFHVDRRTDRNDKAYSGFSQFFECA
jgi:hypothetical protein